MFSKKIKVIENIATKIIANTKKHAKTTEITLFISSCEDVTLYLDTNFVTAVPNPKSTINMVINEDAAVYNP